MHRDCHLFSYYIIILYNSGIYHSRMSRWLCKRGALVYLVTSGASRPPPSPGCSVCISAARPHTAPSIGSSTYYLDTSDPIPRLRFILRRRLHSDDWLIRMASSRSDPETKRLLWWMNHFDSTTLNLIFTDLITHTVHLDPSLHTFHLIYNWLYYTIGNFRKVANVIPIFTKEGAIT